MPMNLAEAVLAHRRLVNWLRASELQGAAGLAATLETCTTAGPCCSAACPRCGIAFQAAMVGAVDHFIRIPAQAIRGRMTATTIVPAAGCLAPDNLSTEACRTIAEEIVAAYASARLRPSLIGLEVSFNEDETGEVEPHWCVHGHGINLDWLSQAQDHALRAPFPPSQQVSKPVHVVELDCRLSGRQYPWKAERVRRVTFLNRGDGKRAPHRDTRHRALRVQQAVTLALIEHELGYAGRLLSHEIDREALRGHLGASWWARDGPRSPRGASGNCTSPPFTPSPPKAA